MKTIALLTIAILIFTACGKLIDDSDSPAELMNYKDQQIKSYDTIIVQPYSDNGGSYYPGKGEASDTIDVDNDGVDDFLLFTSHNQHTGQSPHAWYLDFISYISSVNPDYSIALSPSIPEGIQNFKVGERVGKGYPFADIGYIFRNINNGISEDQSAIRNAGEIFIGIRKEIGYQKYEYGYLQLRYVGYIILQRAVMGTHWTGCQVVSY
jgi:hypothetical protein